MYIQNESIMLTFNYIQSIQSEAEIAIPHIKRSTHLLRYMRVGCTHDSSESNHSLKFAILFVRHLQQKKKKHVRKKDIAASRSNT